MISIRAAAILSAVKGNTMFDNQYNDEMAAEVLRLEAKKRAADAGRPDWENACAGCGCRLHSTGITNCEGCR